MKKYTFIKKEKKYGNSRFDFYLYDEECDIKEYYLEVKGVTLEENGVMRFPDAPTERGTKHIRELIEIKKSGCGAGILFVIQMDGAKYFEPNVLRDPKFTDALRDAKRNGLDILAYECIVYEDEVTLDKEVEVRIMESEV